MATRILLADQHAIFREAIRALIENSDEHHVVTEAGDGRAALELIDGCKPDVIITEIDLPHLSGLELTRRVRDGHLPSKVLVLTAHADRSHVCQALRAGASGYVLKTSSWDELLQAMNAVLAGRCFVSPAVSNHLFDALRDGRSTELQGASILTSREREVLQLVAEGLSSKEIATQLFLSLSTVDSHRFRLMDKLGIHKVSGLVRYAVREGLVEP